MTTLLQTKAPAPAVYLPNDLRPSLLGLSREELMTLFQGELCLPRARKLTDAETRDQALACAFRRALYPDAVK